MDEEGSKHGGLKVTWANQRVIRAFEKGNQTKALSLIRDYLCSDWHPRANDVRAIGVEIRAWIQHGVEPGKCEELERLAMGSRQRMKALGGTLAMLWKQGKSCPWIELVLLNAGFQKFSSYFVLFMRDFCSFRSWVNLTSHGTTFRRDITRLVGVGAGCSVQLSGLVCWFMWLLLYDLLSSR